MAISTTNELQEFDFYGKKNYVIFGKSTPIELRKNFENGTIHFFANHEQKPQAENLLTQLSRQFAYLKFKLQPFYLTC